MLGEHPLAAGVVLGEIDEIDQQQTVSQAQRRLDRIGQPLLGAGPGGQPVDHHLDRVLLLLVDLDLLISQPVDPAIDPHAGKTLGLQVEKELGVLALAPAHHRCEHLEAGALVELEQPVDDLLRGLAGDGTAALRAVRAAGARVEQAQIVVDLGDRADGRAGIARRGLLVDGDGRRQALDEVDIRLVHLTEELPRIRRQALDVTALTLGENRVESEAGLTRPGQPGEDDQRITRKIKMDIAQVVLARTPHDQTLSHAPPPGRRTTPLHTLIWPRFHVLATLRRPSDKTLAEA